MILNHLPENTEVREAGIQKITAVVVSGLALYIFSEALKSATNSETSNALYLSTAIVIGGTALYKCSEALKVARNSKVPNISLKQKIINYYKLPPFLCSGRDRWYNEKQHHSGSIQDSGKDIYTDTQQFSIMSFEQYSNGSNVRMTLKESIESKQAQKLKALKYESIKNYSDIVHLNISTLSVEKKDVLLFRLIELCNMAFGHMEETDVTHKSVIDFCREADYTPTEDHLFYADELTGPEC